MTERLFTDVLVIGSGPGGATTAALLVENGFEVLLVEEGKHLSIDDTPSYSLEEMGEKYRAGGLTSSFGATNVTMIEGRCVGGGSEVNAALYHRPKESQLDSWRREFEIDGFELSDIEPFFESVEKELSVSKRPTGVGSSSVAIADGAKKRGWSSGEVERFWKYKAGEDSTEGRRQSMTETMIPRFLKKGGRLISGVKLEGLKIRGGVAKRAVGSRVSTGEKITIDFNVVFVCCGAIQTPMLLRKSGIKAVGDTLQMHPMIRFAARFDREINDPKYGVPVVQIDEFKPDMTLGGSYSSLPHLALWLGHSVPDREEKLASWRQMAVFYVAVVSKGHGSIRRLPVVGEPLVRFPVADDDMGALGLGVKRMGEALFEAGATEVYHPNSGAPIVHPSGLAELGGGLPRTGAAVSTIHLFSSCQMGGRDDCPLDSWGALKGSENIYINDGSMLPTSPGVNPQGTIIALVRRNVAHFLEGRISRKRRTS
jgi:choline dehydrogenase-like flavoprotein